MTSKITDPLSNLRGSTEKSQQIIKRNQAQDAVITQLIEKNKDVLRELSHDKPYR